MKNHRQIALGALGLAFLIIGSKLSVTLGPVPITFQTFVTAIILLWLGPRLGSWVVAAYIGLGLIGLPVFAAGSGPGYVLKPTFGYLLGFLAGFLMANLTKKPRLRLFILLAMNYGIGVLYLGLMLKTNVMQTLAIGLCPFVWKDIILVGIASIVYGRLAKGLDMLGVSYDRATS